MDKEEHVGTKEEQGGKGRKRVEKEGTGKIRENRKDKNDKK